MNKKRFTPRKFACLITLLLLLVTFTFLSSTQATHAASLPGQSVHPYCSGSTWASPHSQALFIYQQAAVTVYWTCEGSFHVVANINWGDGQSDSYTCWANCNTSNNTAHFTHTYTAGNYYYPQIWMNGYASGSTQVEITVIG